MKLGVLYAMEREAAGLLDRLDARALEPVAGAPVYALPGGHVLAVGGVGKVNAALAAQALIDRFAPDALLNAGCAGAFEDLPVGTLVAAEACVQHDVDTSLAGDPPGLVSTVNVTRFPCVPLPLPGAVRGVVATGDWFGRDYARARAIQTAHRAAVCDMEGAAVAQVCLRNGLTCGVLKAVSDHLFSPAQDAEYRENFQRAMDSLDRAVITLLEGSIWSASPVSP